MVMGPQIVTAIFLVTSEKATGNSLAMLAGVLLGASLGLAFWSVLVGSIGPGGEDGRSGPSTADYVVCGMLALLAIRVWRTRGEARVPGWMSALQQAGPRRAFALGLVLILAMPTDIAATISSAHLIERAGEPAIDAWPLVAGTLLLMALPFLAYTAMGHRAREAMPGIRRWLTANSWLVNLIVIGYFILQLLR